MTIAYHNNKPGLSLTRECGAARDPGQPISRQKRGGGLRHGGQWSGNGSSVKPATDVHLSRRHSDEHRRQERTLTPGRIPATCPLSAATWDDVSQQQQHHQQQQQQQQQPSSFQIAAKFLSVEFLYPLLCTSSDHSSVQTRKLNENFTKSRTINGETKNHTLPSSGEQNFLPSLDMHTSLVTRYVPAEYGPPDPSACVAGPSGLTRPVRQINAKHVEVLTGTWRSSVPPCLRQRSRSYDSLMDCVAMETKALPAVRRSSHHIPFSLQEKRSSNKFRGAGMFTPLTTQSAASNDAIYSGSNTSGAGDAVGRSSTANSYFRMSPATLYRRESSGISSCASSGSGAGVNTNINSNNNNNIGFNSNCKALVTPRTPTYRPLLKHRQTSTGSLSTDTSTSTPGGGRERGDRDAQPRTVRFSLPPSKDNSYLKCRRWMDALPDKFSGLHVFLPPISHDGTDPTDAARTTDTR